MTAASRLAETNAQLIAVNTWLHDANQGFAELVSSLSAENNRLRGEPREEKTDWEGMYRSLFEANSLRIREVAELVETNTRGRAQVGELHKRVEAEAQRADEMTNSRNAALDELSTARAEQASAEEEITRLRQQLDDRELRVTAASLSGGDVTRARQLFDFMTGNSDIKEN